MHEDYREVIAAMQPLRMSQVVRYLRNAGRTEKCPFCGYQGEWDFHVQWPDGAAEPEQDPPMVVFNISTTSNPKPHQCVAITCPQCAHFSLLDINRIQLHLHHAAKAMERFNG